MLSKKNVSLNSEYEQLLSLNKNKIDREMNRLCRPIEDNLNTDAFFYSRLTNGGSYYHLGTRPDILEDYFYSGQLCTSPTLSRLYYTATPTLKVWLPQDENQEDLLPICEYFHRNKLNSGITITVNRVNFREMFYFGTHQAVEFADEYWLNRVGLLYDFIKFFSSEGKGVLKEAENHKVELSRLVGKDFFSSENDDSGFKVDLSQNADGFRKQLRQNSFSERSLTPREAQILQLCIQGKSTKQIASDFGLSCRTVENNIYQIRNKFHCRSTLEVVSKFVGF